MAVVLIPLAGGSPVKIDRPILLIGRAPDCDVVILNSRKVSRKHCILALIGNRFVVRDLASMNGVRVNDVLVAKEASMGVGDVLTVGDFAYRIAVQDLARVSRTPADELSRTQRETPPVVPINQGPLVSGEFPVPLDERGLPYGYGSGRVRRPTDSDSHVELVH